MSEEKRKILTEDELEMATGGAGNNGGDNTTVVMKCKYCGVNCKHTRYSGARVRCENCGMVYEA